MLAAVAYGAVLFKTFQDPSTSFLRSSGKAQWILYDEPADLVAKNPGDVVTSFDYLFRDENTLPAAYRLLREGEHKYCLKNSSVVY